MILVLTFHKNGFLLYVSVPIYLQGNTKVLGDRPKDEILVKCIIYSCTLNFLIVFDDYMTLQKSKWTYLTDF